MSLFVLVSSEVLQEGTSIAKPQSYVTSGLWVYWFLYALRFWVKAVARTKPGATWLKVCELSYLEIKAFLIIRTFIFA